MTLIEVMIAAGLLGVLSLAASQLFLNMNVRTALTEQLVARTTLEDLLRMALLNEQICKPNLVGLPINVLASAVNINSGVLKDAAGNVLIPTGKFGSGAAGSLASLNITSIVFYAVTAGGNVDVPKSAKVRINFTKKNSLSAAAQAAFVENDVIVVPDNTGKVKSCLGSDYQDPCISLGSNKNLTTGQCNKICRGTSCVTDTTFGWNCPAGALVVGIDRALRPICSKTTNTGGATSSTGVAPVKNP